MLQNFLFVAILITIAWVVLIGVYIVLSKQQSQLEQELQELQHTLDLHQVEEDKA